jgi:predicted MFS family arabinose efflux permease
MTAVLSAPLVLRRLGDVRGIACMQLMTGVALAFLGAGPSAGAAVAYLGYMSFQYMSEPGIFKTLMSGVAAGERSGASALYFIVNSIAASLSALLAGAAISRFGYPAVLITAACLATIAAFLFRTLVHEDARASTSQTSS